MSRKDISEWQIVEGDGNVWGYSGPFSWKVPGIVVDHGHRRKMGRFFRLSHKPSFTCLCLWTQSYTEADIGLLVDLEDGLSEDDTDDH